VPGMHSTVANRAYLPSEIQTVKKNGLLETEVKINFYDQYGHPLEVEQPNGLKKSFIYGYNNSQVIAILENVAYGSIPQTLLSDAQSASNTNSEASLLTALSNLRNSPQLADALITTYTHKPLIGISTVTDPRGQRLSYSYDVLNRLVMVKDTEGNILSENQYNTIPQ
jgi:YD repeat-containing protein